jgi:hypothetical protein
LNFVKKYDYTFDLINTISTFSELKCFAKYRFAISNSELAMDRRQIGVEGTSQFGLLPSQSNLRSGFSLDYLDSFFSSSVEFLFVILASYFSIISNITISIFKIIFSFKLIIIIMSIVLQFLIILGLSLIILIIKLNKTKIKKVLSKLFLYLLFLLPIIILVIILYSFESNFNNNSILILPTIPIISPNLIISNPTNSSNIGIGNSSLNANAEIFQSQYNNINTDNSEFENTVDCFSNTFNISKDEIIKVITEKNNVSMDDFCNLIKKNSIPFNSEYLDYIGLSNFPISKKVLMQSNFKN